MQKNTLENQLHGNLLRRTEQLRQVRHSYTHTLLMVPLDQDLEEMSLTNTHQDLELQQEEFKRLCFTIDQTKARLDGKRPVQLLVLAMMYYVYSLRG